jgi:hypothetical protein
VRRAAQAWIAGSMDGLVRLSGADARLAVTWSTRAMALWVLVLLLGYLVLYYV